MDFWICGQEVICMAVAYIRLEIYIEQMEFDKWNYKQSSFANNHAHPKSQYMYNHVTFGKFAYVLKHTAEVLLQIQKSWVVIKT